MTKIGEGSELPKPNDRVHTELQGNIARFQYAMASFATSDDEAEKAHMREMMDQQMALIQANIKGIRRSGIAKQGEAVDGDYQRYKQDPTEANRTALVQDIATLKEYGMLPNQ